MVEAEPAPLGRDVRSEQASLDGQPVQLPPEVVLDPLGFALVLQGDDLVADEGFGAGLEFALPTGQLEIDHCRCAPLLQRTPDRIRHELTAVLLSNNMARGIPSARAGQVGP